MYILNKFINRSVYIENISLTVKWFSLNLDKKSNKQLTQTSISLNVKSLRWNRKFLILIFLITISVASSALGAIYAMIYYIKPTEGQAKSMCLKA